MERKELETALDRTCLRRTRKDAESDVAARPATVEARGEEATGAVSWTGTSVERRHNPERLRRRNHATARIHETQGEALFGEKNQAACRLRYEEESPKEAPKDRGSTAARWSMDCVRNLEGPTESASKPTCR